MKFELSQECVAKNLLLCSELVLHIQGTQIMVNKLIEEKNLRFGDLLYFTYSLYFFGRFLVEFFG